MLNSEANRETQCRKKKGDERRKGEKTAGKQDIKNSN